MTPHSAAAGSLRRFTIADVSDQTAPEADPFGDRNISIHLSEQATLKALRVDGGFHLLVGDDVVIRGITPEHMATLVGSVMDAYVPAELGSKLLTGWSSRRGARQKRREARRGEPDNGAPEDEPADGGADRPIAV